MAARGYFQAFQGVKANIKSVLEGENPGEVVDNDHGSWYRELFAPSVAVGLAKASDLAGYRNGPVYIKGAKHPPPRHEAVRDTMPVFFDLLKEEPEASVRVVLGHFIFFKFVIKKSNILFYEHPIISKESYSLTLSSGCFAKYQRSVFLPGKP